MNNKEFIEEFKNISIKSVCKEQNINYFNIMSGRAGYDATDKVANALADKLTDLLNKKTEVFAVNFGAFEDKKSK